MQGEIEIGDRQAAMRGIPFFHRTDLVRATVTVRERNDSQSVVRANAQFYLRAVEDPEPYRRFFAALEQALFLQAQTLPEDAAGSSSSSTSS